MAKSIFESARKLNALLEKENKCVLVRNGRVVGFVGNEEKYYKKKLKIARRKLKNGKKSKKN